MVHGRGLGMKARLSACCTHIERPRRCARSHTVGCEKDEREMSKAATSLWSAESCSLDTTAALQASKRGSRLNPWWKRTPRHDILSFSLSLSLSVNHISQERRRNSCALQLGTFVTKAAAALHLTKFQLRRPSRDVSLSQLPFLSLTYSIGCETLGASSCSSCSSW
jgi:hypothetical protein